jgi:hypothetical protein
MMTHADALPTYRRIRQVGVSLNHKLVKTLGRATMETAGKRLGIFRNGTLVFESEDETSVLMDYAIYNVRIDGQNAVQRYLDESPPRPDSDEMAILKAMLEAYYSLFQVVDLERGVGTTVRDLLRRDVGFIADIGLSSSAAKDYVFATRVIPLEEQGFLMTAGAALPVTPETVPVITAALERTFTARTDFTRLTPDQESDLAATVIRTCLQSGMSSRIAYGTSAEDSPGRQRSIDPREIRRANRNDQCPCGSGKKFKTCCGRRPRL